MQSVKTWLKRHFAHWLYRSRCSASAGEQFRSWVAAAASQRPVFRVEDVSRDLFTYHGEDGIIAFLLGQLDSVSSSFIDIGAGDCIKSNCASLAVHAAWDGCFLDADNGQLQTGRNFYKRINNRKGRLSFINTHITPDNVNQVIGAAGFSGETGLLSIDIDGNDYWIWQAIDIIRPRIVVIEAKVEFGTGNRLVSYGHHNHHSSDSMYNGASVEALRLLGIQKGYKLVAANKQGYNLFFVKQQEPVKEITTSEVLKDPVTQQSFYPASFFDGHSFLKS